LQKGDGLLLVGILTTLSIIFLIFALQRKNAVLDQPVTINKSFASNTLKPMLMVVFPKDVWEKTQSKLTWADVNYTPADFLSMKILAGVIIPLIVSALGVSVGVDFFVFLVLAVAGYILPDIWLDRKVEARQKSIQKDLYEFELMLSTVISAGLEVVEAFRLVGERFGGEINKEVVRTTMEINTGVHKSKAFEKMAARVGLDDFTKLVYLINQSDRLGTPLSETLNNLVAQMKLDRLLKLQKQAEEAKVKILFPTTVWILVPLLVMMFYPLFTQLKGAF
jgi:tight adherence protein C